jgi:hypothetical protein
MCHGSSRKDIFGAENRPCPWQTDEIKRRSYDHPTFRKSIDLRRFQYGGVF